jgi:hypothetical protein
MNTKESYISDALWYLRQARHYLELAGAPASLDKTRRAIKSAEGAMRHAHAHPEPSTRKVTKRWTR